MHSTPLSTDAAPEEVHNGDGGGLFGQPQRLARPTSIALLRDPDIGRLGDTRKKESDSRNGGIVILRVKELAAHQRFTANRLKSVKHTEVPALPPQPDRNASNAVGCVLATDPCDSPINEHRLRTAISSSEDTPAVAVSTRTDEHLTDPLPDTQLLTGNGLNYSKLTSIAEHRPVAVVPKSLQRSKRLAAEKTISCRLYDCILPAGCTTRNASSEPPESRTPSVVKFDLGHQYFQQQPQQRSASSSSLISRSAQLSKKKFLLDIMDRSVDSIGSCSLDVDADSTDFSGTLQIMMSQAMIICAFTLFLHFSSHIFCFVYNFVAAATFYAHHWLLGLSCCFGGRKGFYEFGEFVISEVQMLPRHFYTCYIFYYPQ